MKRDPICHLLETICKEERLSISIDDVEERFGYDLDFVKEDPRLQIDENDHLSPKTWEAENLPAFLYSTVSRRMWIRMGETGLLEDKIVTFFVNLQDAVDYATRARISKPVYFEWTPDVERSMIWYSDENRKVWRAHKVYAEMCEEVVLDEMTPTQRGSHAIV